VHWTGRAFLLLALLLPAIACQTTSEARVAAQDSGFAPQESGASDDRLVVRTGSLGLRVSDLDAAKSKAEQVISQIGGRVQESRTREQESVWISAWVPAERLDEAMDQLAELGAVESRAVSSEDVTTQHQDLEIRLKNARALRARLRELLGRASGVEDVLAIEKELARVQSEIESMEQRLKDLDGRIEFSSLNINLKRKRVLGPIGYVGYGLWWVVKKLFVIN